MIRNAFAGTDRALLSSQTELFVYPNKYIKSLLFLKKHLHSCILWYILKKLVTLIAMKREVAARVAQVFRGANVKFENWRQVTVQS